MHPLMSGDPEVVAPALADPGDVKLLGEFARSRDCAGRANRLSPYGVQAGVEAAVLDAAGFCDCV